MALSAGTNLDHYIIHSLLGMGGMGEVYLAEDTRLGRKVALKVLPEAFTRDADRLRRFDLEARSASALNHPHILTIFEVGHAGAIHYIATELVEGVTLRTRMDRKRVALREALEITTQSASALAAAHQAGIVHRDIKPENIMIRNDGYVKVLDFGLAKLAEPPEHSVSTQAPTMTEDAKTDPGIILGTVRYMSPEQARGKAVDSRSDIWSLGAVLYEMVTGHVPFAGATKSDLIAAVLTSEPVPLKQYLPEAPAQLQRIIRKALTKEVDERYQDVRDFRIDLKSLKRELEIEAEIHETSTPAMSNSLSMSSGDGKSIETNNVSPVLTTSSLEYLITQTKNHKKATAFVLLGVFLVAVGAGLGLYRLLTAHQESTPFRNRRTVKLTGDGNKLHAAISPDGQYVAYVNEEAGRQSLLIRKAEAEGIAVLVPPATHTVKGVTFARDGKSVYYVRSDNSGSLGELFRVAAPLPGPPKRIVGGVSSPVSLSPDGSRIVFVRNKVAEGESELVVVNSDGTAERRLSLVIAPDYYAFEGPAWSPTGDLIACAKISYRPNYHEDLVGARVEDGSLEILAAGTWANIGSISWLGDGSGLMMIGRELHHGNPQGGVSYVDPEVQDQLWFVPYPAGLAQRITNDLDRYRDLSISQDLSSLITVRSEHVANLWLAQVPGGTPPLGGGNRTDDESVARATQLTRGANKYEGVDGLASGPDGRIFYTSYEKGNRTIWSLRPDGSGKVLLTDDLNSNRSPAVSPDGRLIAYASTRGGERNVWVMHSDGSAARQLTRGRLESDPCFSPDGRWVVYTSISGNSTKPVLWRISVEGGQPEQLNDVFSTRPSVSPDGKSIAFWQSEAANAPLRLNVIPFAGGDSLARFEISVGFDSDRQPVVRWSRDGSSLIFMLKKDGVSNLWRQTLTGDTPKQLTYFTSDEIFWFDLSHDGTRLVISRGAEEGDLVLIKNFK